MREQNILHRTKYDFTPFSSSRLFCISSSSFCFTPFTSRQHYLAAPRTVQGISALPHTDSHGATECKHSPFTWHLVRIIVPALHASPATKRLCTVGWADVCPRSRTLAGRDCLGAIYTMENNLAEPCCWALLSMLKSWELFHSFLGSCEAWQKTRVLHARPIPFLRGADRLLV